MAMIDTSGQVIQTPSIQPTYVPAAPPVQGYMNLPQATPQQPQAQSPSILDLGGKIYKGITSPGTILPQGAATAVDQFGQSVFGIGSQVQGPFTGAAPFTEGTSGGLSSNFSAGNMAAGAAGGFLANKAFGGGVGTNIGSTLGGIVGSFGGPVGSFVGSFIGGGIGSMFGNKKPPNRLQAGGINMQTGEYDEAGSQLFSQKGAKYSEGNAAIRDAYGRAAADMTKYLREQGVEQNGEFGNLVIRVGDRSGLDYFFEKPVTSTETVDFRGSQRNAELMNMEDSERNIQTFGKDIGRFSEGLQAGILDKFNATPEQIAEAQAIFNESVAKYGGATGGAQQTNFSAPAVMVAGKKPTPFDDYMMAKIGQQTKEAV